MRDVWLPKFCEPKSSDYLIRLGIESDGGYIVDSRDVASSDGLLSFGVGDDWTFEKDFLNSNPKPLFAFDGSLNYKFWIKRLAGNIYRRNFGDLFEYIEFRSFFTRNKVFHNKFVGLSTKEGFVSLNQAVDLAGFQKIQKFS